MERKNYYKILQVDPSAEPEVITVAYKRLALKYHPDTNKSPDALQRMQDINEAYKVLNDPVQRDKFDREWVDRSFSKQQYRNQSTRQEDFKSAEGERQRRERVNYEKQQKLVQLDQEILLLRNKIDELIRDTPPLSNAPAFLIPFLLLSGGYTVAYNISFFDGNLLLSIFWGSVGMGMLVFGIRLLFKRNIYYKNIYKPARNKIEQLNQQLRQLAYERQQIANSK